MNLFTFIPNDGDATSFYRAHQPLAHLRRIIPNFNLFHSDKLISPKTIAHMDIGFIQRPFEPGAIAMLELFQENGLKVWIDYDDNLFCVPQDNPAYATFNRPETHQIMSRILREADLVTVSTQRLACELDFIVKRLKGYHVIPNAWNDYIFKPNSKFGKQNVVLWRGTQSHQKDLSDHSGDIVECSRNTKDWVFLFMGYEPWFLRSQMSPDTVFRPPTDIMQYHRFLKQLAPRILIVPLVNNTFNQCKSNIAWIEATISGAVTVAPNWPEWQKPGVFNYNSEASFGTKLKQVMNTDPKKLEEAHDKSLQFIWSSLKLSHTNQMRKQLLESLI